MTTRRPAAPPKGTSEDPGVSLGSQDRDVLLRFLSFWDLSVP